MRFFNYQTTPTDLPENFSWTIVIFKLLAQLICKRNWLILDLEIDNQPKLQDHSTTG